MITIDDEVIDVDTCDSHTSESTVSSATAVSLDWSSLPSATVTRGLILPLMFDCPFFCRFHEPDKTAKLLGMSIDTIPTLVCIGVLNLWLSRH